MPTTKGQQILITGGAGFIGTHLCRKLVAHGHRVRVLDIASPKTPIENVEYIRGDVQDRAAVTQALVGVDAVYHFAALVSVPLCQEQPVWSYTTNLLGTIQVLEALREQVGNGRPIRLIFASSSAVYGGTGKARSPIRESDVALQPLSLYAAQKLASEHAIRVFHELHKLPVVVFRFFNVYGPGQDPTSPYSGVISVFSSRIRRREALTLDGGGLQTRDFVSVHDIVDACAKALVLPASACDGSAMNLGSGTAVSIRELAQEMIKVSGCKIRLVKGPARKGDVKHSRAAIRRAKTTLAWCPVHELQNGLKEVLATQ